MGIEGETQGGFTAGTLLSEVSERERTNARPNSRSRGAARRDRQLGPTKRRILLWLLASQQAELGDGNPSDRDAFQRFGTPWTKAPDKIGIKPSAASTHLRGAGRSLLERRLVRVRLASGRWVTTPTLQPGDRVIGVRLTPEGEVIARLVNPARPGVDLEREVTQRVEAVFLQRYGQASTWTARQRRACAAQILEALDAHRSASGLFGRRLRRATPEEVAELAFTHVSSYAKQNPKDLSE